MEARMRFLFIFIVIFSQFSFAERLAGSGDAAPPIANVQQSQGPKLVELFEYDLPIVEQANTQTQTPYKNCKVASFTYEGVRYYRMVLSSPELQYPLLASGNVHRGTFSADEFSYEDTMPGLLNGAIVNLKYSSRYTLDPKTLKVLRSEMSATDPSGHQVYKYVCQDRNLTS
jgi:hypothetical protein